MFVKGGTQGGPEADPAHDPNEINIDSDSEKSSDTEEGKLSTASIQ